MFENEYESFDHVAPEATRVTDEGVHSLESQTTKFIALDCSSQGFETKGRSTNSISKGNPINHHELSKKSTIDLPLF